MNEQELGKRFLEVYKNNKVSDTYCILRDNQKKFIRECQDLWLCWIRKDFALKQDGEEK